MKTHGYSHSSIYAVWLNMKGRCHTKKNPGYKNYGGRGIYICERWLKFENFLADMGENPKGMTLERIDNNGNYEPSNCRWATRREQSRNRRNIVLLTHNGKTQCVMDWERELGLSKSSITIRLRNGVAGDALFLPAHPGLKVKGEVK